MKSDFHIQLCGIDCYLLSTGFMNAMSISINQLCVGFDNNWCMCPCIPCIWVHIVGIQVMAILHSMVSSFLPIFDYLNIST